jgi:hypothetical protein
MFDMMAGRGYLRLVHVISGVGFDYNIVNLRPEVGNRFESLRVERVYDETTVG